MRRKIVWLVVSCLMALSLVLASCAPAVTEEEEVVTEEKEEVVTEEKEEAVTEEEVVAPEKEMVRDALGKLVEKPKYGGVFTFALSSPISSFTNEERGQASCMTMRFTNEELFEGDWTRGPAGTGECGWHTASWFLHLSVGLLAESWEIPDGDTIIYRIRKGIHWHDKPPVNGREFTAEDVKFTWEHVFGTPTAYMAGSFPVGRRPISYECPDKWTVIVHCEPGRAHEAIKYLGDYFDIMPPEPVEKYGSMVDWRNSCGTGPYMLVDHVAGSSSTLVRNPNYWRKHPLHPEDTMPYVDGIKMLIIPDTSTRLAALRTGKLDYQYKVSWEDFETLMKTNPELQSVRHLPTNSRNIYMRVDEPELPWYDIRVRYALAMAVDRPTIAEEYYGGNAEIFTFPVAPFPELMDLYTPLEELPESTRELFEYHPDKARQLLVDAGYPDGFETEVVCLATDVDVLSIVEDYWADIGVHLKFGIKEAAVYRSISGGRKHKEMIVGGGTNTYYSRFFNFTPPSPGNLSMVDDPFINEREVPLAEHANDWPYLIELWKEFVPYVTEKAWSIELPNPYSYSMWYPWVKGYHGEYAIGQWNGYNFIYYTWLDQDLREEMTGRR